MFDPFTVSAIALKTSLLIVVAGLVASVIVNQSAARRHLLWTAALALSLLMPIAVVYLPSYMQVSIPWQADEPWTRDEPVSAASAEERANAKQDTQGAREVFLPAIERQGRTTRPTAIIVWLIGALLVLLRNAVAHVGLIRWVRKSRSDLSPAWAETLRRVRIEARFRRSLSVFESECTTSPCTWGLIRPVLLLPAAGAGWPEPQRRFALLHELAHVRRFDYLTTQISNLACAMHWYNPLVWFAATQARKLQEHACDDAVLNRGGKPSDYAQFLLSIAGDSRRTLLAIPAAVCMVRRSQFHGRVTAILDASRVRLPLNGMALLVALTPFAVLAFILATVSAVASPTSTQPGAPLTGSFNSVELRNGGDVSLIHGPSQRVMLLKGDPEESSITIRSDGRLVIDRCPKRCSRRHDFEVEVVTPALTAIAVAEGGTIQTRGSFPHRPGIELAVSQGGTIDARSLLVANVTSSLDNGGRIFAKPETALSAKVEQGGIITYWGDAVVTSSVRQGGVVAKGIAADADKTLAELGPELEAPIPPTPPVPPLPVTPPASL